MATDGQRIRQLVRPPHEVMRGQKLGLIPEQGKPLMFPSDLGTHFMALFIHRFEYDGTATKSSKLHKTIMLPVPGNLTETFGINYSEDELGAIAGEISDMVARGNIDQLGDAVGNMLEGVGSLAKSVLQPGGIGAAIGNLRENTVLNAATMKLRGGSGATAAALNRYFGSAPNPHITALFKGVGLKTHNFSWKLAPRNKTETRDLSEIVNSLRASILPERANHNMTLKYPDEIDIYIGGTANQTDRYKGHLYHFKRAVVRNMTTNFAPDGSPSFFAETGAPTAVNITLDLLETSIHTRQDYEHVEGAITKGSAASMVDQSIAAGQAAGKKDNNANPGPDSQGDKAVQAIQSGYGLRI